MMRRGMTIFMVAALMAGEVGCTQEPFGKFTVASTKDTVNLFVKGETVKGEDCVEYIWGFPIRRHGEFSYPMLDIAVRKAIEQAKGDALVDVVASHYLLPALLWNKVCIQVEGKAARLKQG